MNRRERRNERDQDGKCTDHEVHVKWPHCATLTSEHFSRHVMHSAAVPCMHNNEGKMSSSARACVSRREEGKGKGGKEPAASRLTRRPERTRAPDAARWLAEMVELARHPAPQQTAVVTVDVPLVETPILLSSLGAVVTVLDWRPPTSRSQELILNVTLPFEPHMVDSAQGGALAWQPHTDTPVAGSWHTGSVVLTTPRDGADYVSFHRKPTEEA